MRHEDLITVAPIGTKIWFEGERQGYTVRVRSGRYLVCEKPFNLMGCIMYTIVDLEYGIRGVENLIFGAALETQEDFDDMIERLTRKDSPTMVSHRNNVTLKVRRVLIDSDKVK